MSQPMLSGVVLAGGSSRRMGRDKALLDYSGEPLAMRVARLLATVCDDVVLASGDGLRLAQLGLPQVADITGGAGPLAGIIAGLETARHPLVAVVAVDMPDASPPLLLDLAARWDGRSAAVVARAGGRVEPLHAVYARAAATQLRACLEAGERSVHRALEFLGAQVVDLGRGAAAPASGRPASGHPATGHPAFARNLNEPGDLEP